jgi:AcrR family transcriptional regulator
MRREGRDATRFRDYGIARPALTAEIGPLDVARLTNYTNRQPSPRNPGRAMNPQVKLKPEDTRARIMASAEALFRRLGFAKTAVADIAAELRMSPANVYRFFPSKNAIVEAICQRCLSELEEKAWAVARLKAPAAERLEKLFLEILAYNKENLLEEQRVHEVVLVAMEQSWQAIDQHLETMRTIIEVIVRDGMATGEFEALDARDTAELIKRSMVVFTHPVLIGQCVEEHQDLEAAVRQSVRFLLRAITPKA